MNEADYYHQNIEKLKNVILEKLDISESLLSQSKAIAPNSFGTGFSTGEVETLHKTFMALKLTQSESMKLNEIDELSLEDEFTG